MNGEFNPEYSTNSIFYDTNVDECLTTHIEGIESDIASLQTGKANTNHTHTEYAPINHTHTLPTAGSSLGCVKTTSTVSSNSGYTACPIIGGVPYYKDTNTTYNSLKNPYKLTIQFNGSTNKTYDGSSAQTFNITPSAIGVADYVVAQGTSGGLTYRKWNSGVSEAWYYEVLGEIPLTTSMISGVWSNSSYNGRIVNFPNGLFIDIPTAVGNIYGSAYLNFQVASAINSKMVYRIWCPYSTTVSGGYVSIHVVGQWK